MQPPVAQNLPAGRRFSVLVVEDDAGFARMLMDVIQEEGGEGVHCLTLAAARGQLAGRDFEVVLLDNHLPDGKGFDFYLELAKRNPGQTAILLTGLPELAHAVELTRRGLFDYLAKPIGVDALAACLQRARTRLTHLRVEPPAGDLGAASPAMREVAQALQQAARHGTATVLLTGETGVGKDVAARALHRLTFGPQADEKPFVALNCASMPAEMFEAELFGSEKGAYTGADRKREGLVGAARDGTLFLDEIGEVPLAMQAKLLRFLEAREYRPLGSTAVKTFAGRLVAATNRSLRDEVAAGRFRQDLLFRLDAFAIPLPPLRDRRDEIPSLAAHLLDQLVEKYERRTLRLRVEDVEALLRYDYPGNVRELRNLLERSLLRTPPDAGWLALDLAWINRIPPTATPSTPRVAVASPPTTPMAPGRPAASGPERRDLPPLEAQEYELIRQALRAARGGIRRAAAQLGISHQALLRRLQKWPELRDEVE